METIYVTEKMMNENEKLREMIHFIIENADYFTNSCFFLYDIDGFVDKEGFLLSEEEKRIT